MNTEKTATEWLETIENPGIRQKALAYLARIPMCKERTVFPTLSDAINKAFLWEKTDEGFSYWCDIRDEEERKEEGESEIEELKKRIAELEKIVNDRPAEPEEKTWPKDGDGYFKVSSSGGTIESEYDEEYWHKMAVKIGNVYRTREAAQARIDLLVDIHRFEMPKEGGEALWVTDFKTFEKFSVDSLLDKVDFSAGKVLPITATEEDKEKRLELLKKAYNS